MTHVWKRTLWIAGPVMAALAACGPSVEDEREDDPAAPAADSAAPGEAGQALDAQLAELQIAISDRDDQIRQLESEVAASKQGPQDFDLTAGLDALPTARAVLRNTRNEEVGEALFWPASDGVLVRVIVNALEINSGFHGMHFHAIGACEAADGFASAGGHIMPTGLPHGFLNPAGPHEGNLPNIYLHNPQAATGFGVMEVYTNLVTLDDGPAGLLDEDGSTLLIHENVDDHITQPIGGAGGRIACGVVQAAE